MQALKQEFARRRLLKRKRIEKHRYMHCNQVKQGLVLEPEQWISSSFRHSAEGVRRAVLVNEPQKAELHARKVARYHRYEFEVAVVQRWAGPSNFRVQPIRHTRL